ncbi:MAG: hypothetical protein NTY20_03670 [Candidatus Aenigmarchaeota archaeon]|nr:hypothetical protein [Candidatus Aenigmarchaeota archaeon]
MKKSLLLVAAILMVLPFFAAAQEKPRLNITLMSCRELQCKNRADVFLVNESAYIDYNSTVKEISYSAILTFPDGTEYQILFPNRITSNVTGNYTVEIIAWKDGYEETSVSKIVPFVDNASVSQNSQNPITINPIPILAIIIAVLLVVGLWRYFRRTPEKHKGEKHKAAEKKSRNR